METRLHIHNQLADVMSSILGAEEGPKRVFFQPPESIKITYPAIIYELSGVKVTHADNVNYMVSREYSVTVIDEEPDSEIFKMVLDLPYCKFDRFFVSDNLNHFVYTIETLERRS